MSVSSPHLIQDDFEMARAGINYYTREYRDDRPWQALRRIEEQLEAVTRDRDEWKRAAHDALADIEALANSAKEPTR